MRIKRKPSDRTVKKFRFLEHTADMGMEVTGETLDELFRHAAEGLREMIFGEIPPTRADHSEKIAVEGEDLEELLVGWLNELLYLFETRRFVPFTFRIERIGTEDMSATVSGGVFDENRVRVLREIKAVTYHRLMVKRTSQGWRASLYVDL